MSILTPRTDLLEAKYSPSGVLGKTDGAAVAAGYVGQVFSSTWSMNATAGVHHVQVTHNLTAGVWLIIATGYNTTPVGSTLHDAKLLISTVAGDTESGSSAGSTLAKIQWTAGSTNTSTLAITEYVNISTPTTYYTKTFITGNSGGTFTAIGQSRAIRIA